MFRQRIAAKIFGLAIFLLTLSSGLSSYILFETNRNLQALDVVATQYLPIGLVITRLNEHGLLRRLLFERWLDALNSEHPDKEAVGRASRDYHKVTLQLSSELSKAKEMMEAINSIEGGAPPVAEYLVTLEQIKSAYQTLDKWQQRLIDMPRAEKSANSGAMIEVVNDISDRLQERRNWLRLKIDEAAHMAAIEVLERKRRLFFMAMIATITTVLLGLLVASIITERLTKPMRALMVAMRDVQGGNLNLQIPVRSRDELGALTDSFNYFVRELRAKEQMKITFEKYIDPRVVDQMLGKTHADAMAVERRVMSVMFADMVGFTKLSERLTPTLMVTILNRHFELQAHAVQKYQGIVDKFIGDAVMAFWGPPFVNAEEHAVLACHSALAQRSALAILRSELPELIGLRRDAPVIDLRLGICSGDLVVGNIGGEKTRSYTVIGDTVNLSSRIERANRLYGTQVLLSESTAQAVAQAFALREVDTIMLKGKTEAVRIFELLGAAGAVSADLLRVRERYQLALASYRAQDWPAAESLFAECARSGDVAALLMLDRVREFRVKAPSPGWDGAWRLSEG